MWSFLLFVLAFITSLSGLNHILLYGDVASKECSFRLRFVGAGCALVLGIIFMGVSILIQLIKNDKIPGGVTTPIIVGVICMALWGIWDGVIVHAYLTKSKRDSQLELL